MPELERLMLSELARLDGVVRDAYREFDYKRVYFALFAFMTNDLSAFYFDVRKDPLYCDPASSQARHAALTVIDRLFDCLVRWLAPMIPFTCDEAWTRAPRRGGLACIWSCSPTIPPAWRDAALEAKWENIRAVRRVVLARSKIERKEKRIGSSLEAAPVIHLSDPDLLAALETRGYGGGRDHQPGLP